MKTAESAFLQAEIAQADSYVSFRGSHNILQYAYAHQLQGVIDHPRSRKHVLVHILNLKDDLREDGPRESGAYT